METKAKCPKCGSMQIQAVSETKTQGFSAGKGCCGFLLLGPFGWLCGLCGLGKGESTVSRVCIKCGHKF